MKTQFQINVFTLCFCFVFASSAYAQPCDCQSSAKKPFVTERHPTPEEIEEFNAPVWSWKTSPTKAVPAKAVPAPPQKCVPLPPPQPLHSNLGGAPGYTTSLSCIKQFGIPTPPTATENKRCQAETYEEAIRDANGWREALGVDLSRGLAEEREISRRLEAVNSRLGDEFSSIADGWNADHGLVDSLLVLRIAEKVVREHGGSELLVERFELEAEWINLWLKVVPGEHELVHETIVYWWRHVAAIWARNARAFVGKILINQEPFKTLFSKVCRNDILAAQGDLWFKGPENNRTYAPYDAFYTLVDSHDPWLWLEFKAMPIESSTEGTPMLEKFDRDRHPEMNKKIERMVVELVGK